MIFRSCPFCCKTWRRVKSVIERQLRSWANIPHRVHVQPIAKYVDLAIRIAAMIDEARVVSVDRSVDYHPKMQMDEVHARVLTVGDIGHERLNGATRPRVFDDARSTRDYSFCEDTSPFYAGWPDANEIAIRLSGSCRLGIRWNECAHSVVEVVYAGCDNSPFSGT